MGDEVIELPAGLQSPAIELTYPELLRAALVFERSLASLHKLLPSTPVLVAYIPSPLSTYRLHSPVVSIQSYLTDRAVHYPKERVAEYSNVICGLIRAAALDRHVGFLDLRPAIRAAASRHLIHGPRDFKHFNRKGMEVLGRMVAQRVNQPLVQESCEPSGN